MTLIWKSRPFSCYRKLLAAKMTLKTSNNMLFSSHETYELKTHIYLRQKLAKTHVGPIAIMNPIFFSRGETPDSRHEEETEGKTTSILVWRGSARIGGKRWKGSRIETDWYSRIDLLKTWNSGLVTYMYVTQWNVGWDLVVNFIIKLILSKGPWIFIQPQCG